MNAKKAKKLRNLAHSIATHDGKVVAQQQQPPVYEYFMGQYIKTQKGKPLVYESNCFRTVYKNLKRI